MHTSKTADISAGELSGFSDGPAGEGTASCLTAWCRSPFKRAFDFAVALALLTLLWPIMLIVAAAIKLSSPGPVLFRQERVGRNGKHFQLLKFRSMRAGAGHSGPGITRCGDARIFPLGRLLRKWKLDELPQFVNVLRGNMSLVGPRPDLPEFCAALNSDQRAILLLRPGITGAATVKYRNEEHMLAGKDSGNIAAYYLASIYPEKVRLDLDYARNASFAGDLMIMLQTAAALFF